MSVDRTGKLRLERLARMALIPSPECRAGIHGSCSGLRQVVVAGEAWRSEDGKRWAPDTFQTACGCPCHTETVHA